MRTLSAALLCGAALLATACAPAASTVSTVPPPTIRASEPVQLQSGDVTLHGTLEIPAGSAPFAVALIIAGSGPTDRNGNSPLLPGPNNNLRMLADSLAASGIASLRYDKRGIGQSAVPTMREDALRFTTYSDDAAAWVDHLRADPRFSDVVIMGHSEGALLGTLAANAKKADGLVLLAGAGRPIADVIREQLKAGMPAQYAVADSLLRELEQGRAVTNVPPALLSIFRPSLQPYMISWLPLDPAAELARFGAPSLVIQGTTDVQVATADAERLATAGSTVRMVLIDGVNHLLKRVSGTAAEQMPSYGDPNIPLDGRVVREVVSYIKRIQ